MVKQYHGGRTRLPAVHLVLVALLLTTFSCGGGGGGGGGGDGGSPDVGVPVLSSVTLSPTSAPAGSSVVISVTFTFSDPGADLAGGSLQVDWGGTLITMNLSSYFQGRTNGTATGTITFYRLGSATGGITVSCRLVDSAGHQSNAVSTVFNQPAPHWPQQWGSDASDTGYAAAIDGSDNIWVGGMTNGSLDHISNSATKGFLSVYKSNAIKLGTSIGDMTSVYGLAYRSNLIFVTGVTSADLDGQARIGGQDAFVMYSNRSSGATWTRILGTATDDMGWGVTSDATGVYVTGYTAGALDGETNAGSWDVFLTKYNLSGTKLWTKLLGGTDQDMGRAVKADGNGNVYVVGYAQSVFDGQPAITAGLTAPFLTKYDSAGNKAWTRVLRTGEGSNSMATGVAIDSFLNVYVVGRAWGALDGEVNAGNSDAFITKYDPASNRVWTRLLGTATTDEAYAIAIDASDNIYIAGYTTGNLDGNVYAGNGDGFVAKYDKDGDRKWTRTIATSGLDIARGVAVDSSGYVYVTGQVGGSLSGSTALGNGDVFLVKYDANGVAQ